MHRLQPLVHRAAGGATSNAPSTSEPEEKRSVRSKAVPTSLAPELPMGEALAPALRAEGSTDAKYLHT
jgi:hypothetical protein